MIILRIKRRWKRKEHNADVFLIYPLPSGPKNKKEIYQTNHVQNILKIKGKLKFYYMPLSHNKEYVCYALSIVVTFQSH
jgi:hypothetical protein